MDEKRTFVIWIDGNGDIIKRTLMTDDQIRLLEWLRDQDFLSDWPTYNILDDDQPEFI